MSAFIFDKSQLKNDPAERGALDKDGRLVVHEAAFWKQFSQVEISMFCVRHGLYSIPTFELVQWLSQELGQDPAIEIGAGNGVLADALGIPAYDNKMQDRPEVQAYYKTLGQTPVTYGPNVVEMDAEMAVYTAKPKVVIAAWVTHLYDPSEHWREGNAYGVREEEIIKRAKYIFVGNTQPHKFKPILEVPHTMHRFPWLVSRGFLSSENFIAVWEKK